MKSMPWFSGMLLRNMSPRCWLSRLMAISSSIVFPPSSIAWRASLLFSGVLEESQPMRAIARTRENRMR